MLGVRALPALCAASLCLGCVSSPAPAREQVEPAASAPTSEAHLIWRAATDFLAQPDAIVGQHLGPDMLPHLQRQLDEPRPSEQGTLLAPWYLEVNGASAELTYTPPQLVTAHARAWFVLGLEQRDGRWQVDARGLRVAHATARRSE